MYGTGGSKCMHYGYVEIRVCSEAVRGKEISTARDNGSSLTWSIHDTHKRLCV